MPKGKGYGKSMTHAATADGAAGTYVDSDGKTSVRKTIDPPFGKRSGGKRSGRKRGGRSMSRR